MNRGQFVNKLLFWQTGGTPQIGVEISESQEVGACIGGISSFQFFVFQHIGIRSTSNIFNLTSVNLSIPGFIILRTNGVESRRGVVLNHQASLSLLKKHSQNFQFFNMVM